MEFENASQKDLPWLNRYLPFLVSVLWLGFFAQTFLDLWQRWVQWDQSLAHGIPVIGVFFFLLWKTGAWRKEYLISPTAERWLSGTALLGASLLWFLALAVNIQIIEQLLLLPLLVGAYALIYGWGAVWRHRFLLLFPIFAIPVWGSLNGILLEATSIVVGQLVRWAQMPAIIQGNSIYIPYGHILIADGCSGLRYFVIALTLGYLIAYLNGYREGKILLTLAVAATLGLITNWIRIFVLIVIGYKTQMESSLMADHEFFGLLLFAAICLPAFVPWPLKKKFYRNRGKGLPTTTNAAQLTAAFMLMATGPIFSLWLHWQLPLRVEAEAENTHQPQTLLPEMPLAVLVPDGATTSIERLSNGVFWRCDAYHRNGLDEKLVPYLPRLYNYEKWLLQKDTPITVHKHLLRYQVFQTKGGPHRVAQIQWFNVGGHITNSATKAKLLQIPATLRRQNQFEIVTLQARCRIDGCGAARSSLIDQSRKKLLTADE